MSLSLKTVLAVVAVLTATQVGIVLASACSSADEAPAPAPTAASTATTSEADAVAYLGEADAFMDEVSILSGRLSGLSGAPDLGDPEWQSDVVNTVTLIAASTARFRQIDPPALYEEFHAEMVEGARYLNDGAKAFQMGVAAGNADTIGAAATLLAAANQSFSDANQILRGIR